MQVEVHPEEVPELSVADSNTSGGVPDFDLERKAMPDTSPNGVYLPYRRALQRFVLHVYDPASSDHQIQAADLQRFLDSVNSLPFLNPFPNFGKICCGVAFIAIVLPIALTLCNILLVTYIGLWVIGLNFVCFFHFGCLGYILCRIHKKGVKTRQEKFAEYFTQIKPTIFRGLEVNITLSKHSSFIFIEFLWRSRLMHQFPRPAGEIGLRPQMFQTSH